MNDFICLTQFFQENERNEDESGAFDESDSNNVISKVHLQLFYGSLMAFLAFISVMNVECLWPKVRNRQKYNVEMKRRPHQS